MILDRLRFLDPRRFFKKKEPAEAGEAEALAPEIEDEAVHPDKDEVLKLIRLAVQLAFVGCYAFMVLFCLQFVGKVKFDIDWQWGTKGSHFSVDIGTILNLLPLFAVLVVSFGILVYAKAWVTYFAEEKERVAKWLAFSFGMMSIGVVVLGSLSVNQEARQEDFRSGLIAEEQVENKAAGDQALITLKEKELARMQAKPSYQGLAASAGAESWAKKIAMTPATDANYRQISRAITDAEAADKLKAEIQSMTVALAQSTTKAEVKADVGAVMDDPVTKLVRDVAPWRMPLMVLTMDLILVFGLFLGRSRYKRLQAEWNAAIRRKADAAKESADAAQRAQEQANKADPSSSETGDPQSGNKTEGASSDPQMGAEKANPESGVEETTTETKRESTVKEHTRRVYQRKLRPATLEELKAAGLYTEEPANDPDPELEGSPEQSEAREGMDAGGMDQGGAGPDRVSDIPEAGVDGGESDLLGDEQPEMDAQSEAPEGEQQGTEAEAGTSGSDPAEGGENEKAA